MGLNNKQRRAAKQRKRTKQRSGHQRPGGFAPGADGRFDDPGAGVDPAAFADFMVGRTVRRLVKRPGSDAELLESAAVLQRGIAPLPPQELDAALDRLLGTLLRTAQQGGWDGHDLGELVRRKAGDRHLELLTRLLEGGRRSFGPLETLASGLRIAALLASVPPLGTLPGTKRSGPGRRAAASAATTVHTAQLEKVRALLAKAESTGFDAEAEALTAKAQELISRYSLERLLEEADDAHGGSRGPEVTFRRLWLDSPYVLAKASLVHEVAAANRCHSVVSEKLGFCTVVGDPMDLDAVELLLTSLLVQATSALLRHGQQVDGWGVSRTRSFRQSFLVAFASRIGERLRGAADDAVRESGQEERLLPVLHDQEARVAETFEALFPSAVTKETSISNPSGYAAGRSAADLALLDVHANLEEGVPS